MTNIIISKTGQANGFGSDRFKSVTKLTKEEREAVISGGIVLVEGCPPAHGKTGTTLRQVTVNRGKFYHRVPSAEILDQVGE